MSVNVSHIFEENDFESRIVEAASLLREGGVVVLPTETVYGAAGILSKPTTVERLRALRESSNRRAFTVHVARAQQARNYLGETNDLARRMMKKLWPGPVALIFDVPPARQQEVAAKTGAKREDLYDGQSITLRCPDHLVAMAVLSGIDAPIALTMVERTGVADRPGFDHLEKKVDLVLDAGPTRFAKPSTIVRVMQNKWEIVRAGIYDQRIIERLLRTTVLFVCSGNTCRSPMAEAIARLVIAEHLKVRPDEIEARGFSVMSAGSYAMTGAKATPQGVEAVRALGADLSKHRSKPLSVELIHEADVVFAMGRSHQQAIVGLVPGASEKTMLLNPEEDIEDPIGGDASLYNELAVSLRALIERRLNETVFQESK